MIQTRDVIVLFCISVVSVLLVPAVASAAEPQAIGVTVRLEKTSAIPDPKKSLYSHCLVMHKARAIKGLDGVPREIVVAFWGFRDRKLDAGAACKPGDYLEVQMVPWEQTDPKVREIQQSDQLAEPDLDLYWTKASVVLAGEAREQALRLDKSLPAVPAARKAEAKPAAASAPTAGPGAEKARRLRAVAIQADKERIAAALRRNGGSFVEWHKRLKPFYDDINQQLQSPTSEWKVLTKGKVMLSNPLNPPPDRLKGQSFRLDDLVRCNTELRERGIDLIMVPVPEKGAFTSVFFSEKAPADRVVMVHHQWFMQQLLENDIEVIDLLPAFHAAADDSPETPYIYNFNRDHHWSSGGRMAAARALAERLARYDFPRLFPPDALTLRTVMAPRDEDMEGKQYDPPGSYLKGRKYPVFQVECNWDKRLPGPFPVAVAGDSMVGEGPSMPGIKFADYLLWTTGVPPVPLLGHISSAEGLREQLIRQAKLLEGRRVLVFVFLLAG